MIFTPNELREFCTRSSVAKINKMITIINIREKIYLIRDYPNFTVIRRLNKDLTLSWILDIIDDEYNYPNKVDLNSSSNPDNIYNIFEYISDSYVIDGLELLPIEIYNELIINELQK